MSKPEQIKWEESEKVRDLLKKQNSLLGDSLEALDHLIRGLCMAATKGNSKELPAESGPIG